LFLDAIEEATLQKQIVDLKPLKESSSQAAGYRDATGLDLRLGILTARS